MNVKYKGIGRKSVAGLLLCLMGVLTACEDDFGKNGTNSGVLTMKVEVPEGWTSGVAVDEEAPDSRCVSVDAAASESSIPLYLHTIESDNTVAVPSTRGALKTTVEKFSMSAICYEEEEGTYGIPNLTPNFAYDLTCTVKGEGENKTASYPESLLWPANGKVRFFAFAPVEDSSKPFTLSGATVAGAPTITYTVPEDITTQHDLMAACTDATSANVTLNFRHILTAVKVVTAEDMIPGEITEVTFSGIPNMGTYTPSTGAAKDKWKIDETSKGIYTVQPNVIIEGDYTIDDELNIDIKDKDNREKQEVIDGNLTLLMIPQTLPDGAKLVVKFKEALSGHEFTLSADLKGKKWSAGQIVTYSISPSSIHIKPVVEFNKKPEDILPYSGVWHDVKVRAYAEVTKDKEVKKVEEQIPEILYSFDGGNSYSSGHFYDSNGINELEPAASTESSNVGTKSEIADNKVMCVLQAQKDFKILQDEFKKKGLDIDEFKGSKDNPSSLLYEKSGYKSANCYMVGQPGYYKFPAVYGNTYKGGNYDKTGVNLTTTTNGMQYYPDWEGERIYEGNYDISKNGSIGIEDLDAVLAWQDAPDLIDNVELMSEKENGVFWVKFRVRKHSITQGNALIVARKKNSDGTKTIVWSWHIWVSQHTKSWMSDNNNCQLVKSIYKSGGSYTFTGKDYELANFNLGYCDPHKGDVERKFKIKFNVKVKNLLIEVTKYRYTGETTVNTAEDVFTQAEFKGSDAGDNTYYQWGRNAPTPGGIYNASTPNYSYWKKNNEKNVELTELNMENKPLFNVYANKDENAFYNLTRNIDLFETGATINWAIQHPYVFIMSQYDKDPAGGGSDDNYRDHWHKRIGEDDNLGYALEGAMLFQMWNPKANGVKDANVVEDDVAKSVYDPCPAGYLVPPANLFSAFAYAGSYGHYSVYTNVSSMSYTVEITPSRLNTLGIVWTVKANGQTFNFPATGVRNKSLRLKEFESVKLDGSKIDLKKQTYPAFRILTYLSASTMCSSNGGQVPVFYIDNRYKANANFADCMGKLSETPGISCYQSSADSYGLSVRPMREP